MLLYILKLSACLGVFLAFYKLFLEKENMHLFKRFYLIGAVLISIIIPLITFTQYIEPQSIINDISAINLNTTDGIVEESIRPSNYLPIIIWSIYGIGALLFGLKFVVNLYKIISKIRKNPKQKNKSFVNVLLNDLITPHTFFSYIFLNKHKYETHQIPEEVIYHEQTHARQKHSIDVLFIELLQIFFWFNPLIHVIKNSIKLNHEFLADEAVLNNGVQSANYQQILLAFSTNQKETQLANAINYSSIKKRFTVMKTQTSKTTTWIRSFILLPLLAFMVYSFSSTKEVIKTSEDLVANSSDYTARSISIEVLENGTYTIDGLRANKNSLLTVAKKLHQDITPEIRNNIMNIHVTSSSEISNEEVWFIYNSLLDYGFYRMVAGEQEVVKGKGNTPFSNTQTQKYQDGASRELMKEYDKLAKHYNAQSKSNMLVKSKDVERMKYIYGLMSEKQKKSAEPFPSIPPAPAPPSAAKAPQPIKIQVTPPPPPPPPLPENATKEQKIKYEENIKKYKIAVERAKEKTVSKEQMVKLKKEKEAYVTRQTDLKREKLAYKEARAEKIKAEKAEVALVREMNSEEVKKLKKEKMAYMEEKKERQLAEKRLARVKEIKPPKPPKSPLDHVIEMAKKDANFYLEGKKISSDQAIKELKNNKSLNIQTYGGDSDQPKVFISKKPIVKEQ